MMDETGANTCAQTTHPLCRGQLRVVLWIFLTLSVFYIGLTRGRFLSTDEIHVYQATRSLWEHGTTVIQSPEGYRGRGDHRYAVVNSGLSVASLPLYGVGKFVEGFCLNSGKQDWLKVFAGPVVERVGGDRWSGEAGIFFVNLFNCFATAALVALFYCFSLELGATTRWALSASGLLALTSYVAPFSTGFFQHSSEAFFLLAAFYFLFRDRQSPDWRWRLCAGLSAALLIQFRFPGVVALPALIFYHGIVLWNRSRQRSRGTSAMAGTLRQAAPFAVALVFGFLLHALDQYAKFGTVRSVGNYAALRNHNPLLVGLYAFLFSPGDSIFLFTPLLLLAPWALYRLYRRYPVEVAFILFQTGFYLFFYSKFDDWHGLWCFGPRYLVPLVPLLLLPLALWLQEVNWKRRLIAIPLAFCGLWIQAIHFTADFWTVAQYENYLNFQPPHGFLFIPSVCQVVAHSRAMLAWDSRVTMWLVTVYRGLGPATFWKVFLTLVLLLAGCLWRLQLSLRRLSPVPSAEEETVAVSSSFPAVLRAKHFRRFAAIGLVVLLLIPYSNHFYNSFHFDDAHTIQTNGAIRTLANIPKFFSDATTFSALPSNQSYRPLVSTMLAIDYWLGNGLWPFWFHLTIFILFAALVLLFALVVYCLLQEWKPSPWNRWIAVFAAGLYGIHPANADTVNYVIASSDVISTLGIVASFAIYFAFPAQRRFYLFALPAAVSILAKPPAIVFAVLFALYLLIFPFSVSSDARPRNRLRSLVRLAFPPLLLCAAVLVFVQRMTPRTWIAGAMNPSGYLMTQPYVALRYVGTFFWPSDLSADYDLATVSGWSDPRFWIGFGFVFLLIAGAVVCCASRRSRLIGFGLSWFVIGLLPTSLFPLAEVMNDHRAFLPYLGLIIAFAGAAALVCEHFSFESIFRRRAIVFGVFLVLASGAYATYERNQVWRSEETLWRDVTLKSPRNGRGLMNFGLTLMAKGNYNGALDYFHRALVLTPQYPFLFINLAIAENAIEQTAQAEAHFRQALQLAPGLPDAYTFYGRFLMEHHREAEARSLLQKAADLSPTDETVRGLLGELTPSAEAFVNLSLQRYQEGRFKEAIAASRKALEMRPSYAEAWNNLGAAYNAIGDYEKGVSACQKALEIRPDFVLARNNLAFAQERLKALSVKQ